MKIVYILIYFLVLASSILSGCGGDNAYAAAPDAAMPEKEFGQITTQSIVPSKLSKDVRQVIILGDSIMHTSHSESGTNTYSTTAAILQQAHGMHVTNISLSGQTVQDAAASGVGGAVNYLTNHGHSKLGTAVWIEIGVNDWIFFHRSPEEFAADYTQLLSSIERGPYVTIYCVSMLASFFDAEHWVAANGTTLDNMRAVVRDIGNSGLCQYVDTSKWFSTAEIYDGYTMPDGLHLGSTGHTKYSNLLLETIKSGG